MRKAALYARETAVFLAILILALIIIRAILPKAHAHDFYTGWQMPHKPGKSCCNKQDCEPVQGRKDDDGSYHALIEGQWRATPKEIILDPAKPENKSPGGYHACWNRTTKELLCFREEETKI
jgi:hypothetical protein